jgi:DNA helicase-2/ATP-dependent DNA helicase PcrA
MDILAGLNLPQREAVETIEGPLLILAGPGSGKTRVIAHRVAYLVKVCGTSPSRIMAVTFTNKAAREMRERLENLLGETAQRLTLGTFHATCAGILRRDGQAIGITPGFIIYDEEDQLSVIKRSLEELNIDAKRFAPKSFRSAIKGAKNQLVSPEDYLPRSYSEELVRRVYHHYQQSLSQSQALDFDDLLMRTVQLFQSYPEIASEYQSRYLYLLVDEFQDTNLAQYALAKKLAEEHRNICVVGDPDQSIYSWRYADLRNILNFEKDYPEAKVVVLEQNYRSTQTILAAAHQVISVNCKRKEKPLWTENEKGIPITAVKTYDEDEEARFIVSEIARLMSEDNASPSDFAVMYRTNAQSRAIEETFIRYGFPYQLVGALRFYERKEVKDVLAYLRVVHNPSDAISLTRIINVPGRGIGQRTVEELFQWTRGLGISLYHGLEKLTQQEPHPFPSRSAKSLVSFSNLLQELISASQNLKPTQLIDLAVERTGYRDYLLGLEAGEERWENIRALRAAAEKYQHLPPNESLTAFLEGVALVSDVDNLNEKKKATTLITLHQAKGLEFPIVFIAGMEDGLLPHIKSFDDPGQFEEERRLCYVGMTRAKKCLYLTHTMWRSSVRDSHRKPSPFLKDISPHLIKSIGLFESGELSQLAITIPSPLEPGELVHHPKFGEGVVVACLPVRDDYEVVVNFNDFGEKKLLLSLAKLEK